MMTGAEIRQQFFDFFKSKNHVIVPSAPIVIKDDPTLLFTNAGMNQFKDIFLGNNTPVTKRVADTQKCLRVSGKHNDLEEVGVDTYHHTMFEMLGNWSFGDYFKKEAIAWSWELLTKIYKIPEENLYVTIFEGDSKENLPADKEAAFFWKEWINEDRIIMGNKKDNFWEMGDVGPCGPCTEIHVDCRSEEEKKLTNGKELVNKDHPQVIEIWNNVFIQFNRKKDGSLEELPSRHVDTGMGFERLTRVLQQKQSNYDTDIFTGTIAEVENIVQSKYTFSDKKADIAFRVIADHIRAIVFTIADGQMPANVGAGYVIRRILRRAVRYYFSYLNYKKPLLHQVVPLIASQFANVFPEILKQEKFIAKVVLEEEQGFLRTLDAGLKKMQVITLDNNIISGKSAFELYDTFGFPLDLTKLIASENNIEVDEEGFSTEMAIQKNRSRAAGVVSTEDWVIVADDENNLFVGYDMLEIKTKIAKYRASVLQGKKVYHIVLKKTPFYAESGGQVGDKGILSFSDESIEVINTKKENDLIIHYTESLPKDVTSDVTASVMTADRFEIASNHTATHLLHAALRNILGNHVAQKGSLVTSKYLRFDFSHFNKLSDEEILMIEQLVNQKIRENIPVSISIMPKDQAMATGAMALFGEKYGDTVRVVTIDPDYSVELCGGTHTNTTGTLGFFKIIQETAVGAGIRRIEAVCGKAFEEYIESEIKLLNQIRSKFNNPKDISKAINNSFEEVHELRYKFEKIENTQLETLKKELLNHKEIVNGLNFIGKQVSVSNIESLKKICFLLKNTISNYLIILTAEIDGKAAVAILIDDEVANNRNLDAGKIIKEKISPLIKGGGGGQKTLATAGGQDPSNLQTVIQEVKKLLS
ncbi:MAG: alanine--tRNA ligase [Ginsengibacter sp.]